MVGITVTILAVQRNGKDRSSRRAQNKTDQEQQGVHDKNKIVPRPE